MTGPSVIVDPDVSRRGLLVRALKQVGLPGILEFADAAGLEGSLSTLVPPQLAIVAVGSANDAPLDLLSRLRVAFTGCLLIAVDAADTRDSAALPFAAGAHDVLRLPLRAAELEARIAQGLARLAPARAKIAEIAGGIIARLNLTPAETKVLRILASRQGQIVTRDELSRHLYGTPWTYGDRRFDVHVTKIRRKLRDEAGGMLRLRTVRAEGYTLEYAAAESAVTS